VPVRGLVHRPAQRTPDRRGAPAATR
jgi:hypothetical protein